MKQARCHGRNFQGSQGDLIEALQDRLASEFFDLLGFGVWGFMRFIGFHQVFRGYGVYGVQGFRV